MSTYTFSTSSGFLTSENITLINTDIDAQVLDSTRTNSEIIGDTMAITFSPALSDSDISIINGIFSTRDNQKPRGQKIISIYPMTNIKTTTFQIISRFPCRNWNITNIEVSGFMQSSLTSYTVRIYDPVNDLILVEKALTNTIQTGSDLGTISNLPTNPDVELEVQVKITPSISGKCAYIESILIYYD